MKYICVECGEPVPALYSEYGRGNIVPFKCTACNRIADKYIEFDLVIIFIDMLLHKPQVYRHLLYNRYDSGNSTDDTNDTIEISPKPPAIATMASPNLATSGTATTIFSPRSSSFLSFHPSASISGILSRGPTTSGNPAQHYVQHTIPSKSPSMVGIQSIGPNIVAKTYYRSGLPWGVMKLGMLLVLLDVYVKWSRIANVDALVESVEQFLPRYLWLILICSLEFILYVVSIRIASSWIVGWEEAKDCNDQLGLALIISSFGKLLHIMMVIWDYHDGEYSWVLNPFILTCNAEAISVVYKISYLKAYILVGIGVGCKFLFQSFVSLYDSSFPASLF